MIINKFSKYASLLGPVPYQSQNKSHRAGAAFGFLILTPTVNRVENKIILRARIGVIQLTHPMPIPDSPVRQHSHDRDRNY